MKLKKIIASILFCTMTFNLIGFYNITVNADELSDDLIISEQEVITDEYISENDELSEDNIYVDEQTEESQKIQTDNNVIDEEMHIALEPELLTSQGSIGLETINEEDYILDSSGVIWFKEYPASYCTTDRFRFYSQGKNFIYDVNLKDAPGYINTRGLNGSYWIDFYNDNGRVFVLNSRIDSLNNYNINNLAFSGSIDLSQYPDGEYHFLFHLVDENGVSYCAGGAGNIKILIKNQTIYFSKPYCDLKSENIDNYNSMYQYLYEINPYDELNNIKNSITYNDMSDGLKEKAIEIKNYSGSDYRTVLNIKSWLCLQKIGDGKSTNWNYCNYPEIKNLQIMLAYLSIPSIRYNDIVFAYVDNRWVAMKFLTDSYPDGQFDLSKNELASLFSSNNYSIDNWKEYENESVNNEEIITIDYDVIYHQSEARSMLKMINDFRTGKDAWFWTNMNPRAKVDENGNIVYDKYGDVVLETDKCIRDNLLVLEYDYDLEKIAMQRAAEIVAFYEHERPNGSNCFGAYKGYNYLCAGENIAYGYNTAEEVFTAWREDNESYYGQGHRRNMLEINYNRIGIACVEYNGVKYWVQEFAYSEGNITSTNANDSKTNVNVEIKKNRATIKIDWKKNNINITVGEKIDLPSISIKLNLLTTDNVFLNIPRWAYLQSAIGYR